MSLTFAYSALAAGVLVWLVLVSRLRARPWETTVASANSGMTFPDSFSPAKVGLWAFLAVITSLFGLFISAFHMRMGHGPQVASDWRPFPEPLILWINTAVLILSSVAMQWAKVSLARGDAQRTRTGLLVGGALAIAFLVGQFLAWRLIKISGYLVPGNPAVAFFYVLTGIHVLHLFGGVFVWGKTAARLRKAEELIEVRSSIELVTVYFHYLLFIWLVLYALLLTHAIDSQLIFERLC